MRLFLGRIAVALVLGWTLGLMAAYAIAGPDIGVLPALTILGAIPLVYLMSFFVVRPGGRR